MTDLITVEEINLHLEQEYRADYDDTALVIAPVAVPVGKYRMEKTNEPAEGAIFVGDARLLPCVDGAGTGSQLTVERPNVFAYGPYSVSQFYVAGFTRDGDGFKEGEDYETFNIYSNSVGGD